MTQLIQLIGPPGSGTRRLALHFVQPARSVIWINRQWNLHAPLLWKLAADRGTKLLGLECPDRPRWRMLWRELVESKAFDGWVLDHLELTPGESAFLKKITRRFSLRILALDERPRALWPNRAHLQLSHHSYRVQWSKGSAQAVETYSAVPQYFASPFLEIFHTPAVGRPTPLPITSLNQSERPSKSPPETVQQQITVPARPTVPGHSSIAQSTPQTGTS